MDLGFWKFLDDLNKQLAAFSQPNPFAAESYDRLPTEQYRQGGQARSDARPEPSYIGGRRFEESNQREIQNPGIWQGQGIWNLNPGTGRTQDQMPNPGVDIQNYDAERDQLKHWR